VDNQDWFLVHIHFFCYGTGNRDGKPFLGTDSGLRKGYVEEEPAQMKAPENNVVTALLSALLQLKRLD
jgi:hypothetical protein